MIKIAPVFSKSLCFDTLCSTGKILLDLEVVVLDREVVGSYHNRPAQVDPCNKQVLYSESSDKGAHSEIRTDYKSPPYLSCPKF